MAEKKEGSVIIIKKKKGGGHGGGHHGGAWKVAYADFVTAMMAFFMVMWLMGSDEEVKASVEDYFNQKKFDSADGSSRAGRVSGGDGTNRSEGEQGRFEESMLERPSMTAPVYLEEQRTLTDMNDDTHDGAAFSKDHEADKVKFHVPGKVAFEVGLNVVPVSSYQYLNHTAEVLRGHDGTVNIEGWSDGDDDWALSFGRAMAVRNYLIKEGKVSASKLIPVAAFTVAKNGRSVASEETRKSSVTFTLKRTRSHE